MRRRKSDWLLIAVGGLLGAFIGLCFGFFTVDDGPGTLSPFDISIVQWPREAEPELHVTILDQWHYSHTSPNRGELDLEVLMLRLGPGILIVGFGFALGVQAGAIAGRWAQRRRAARPTRNNS